MWSDLVALMPQGVIDDRIDTVRPEHSPEAMGRDPRVDRHGGEVYVYRRHEQGCLVCGTPVRLELHAARNLYWCPRWPAVRCGRYEEAQGPYEALSRDRGSHHTSTRGRAGTDACCVATLAS